MAIPEGLQVGLNEIRETSIDNGTLYHQYVDQILPTTDIGSWASPILTNPNVMNEFMQMLVQRIVYTQIQVKLFNNPLKMLEGDRLPLGAIGQEIAFNPIKARRFNVDDFAGLLAKYEADVKVQYMHLNSDLQYCVTITRAKIKDAFTSWENLNSFVDGITQSVYNGAYIDHFRMTKDLVASAYSGNNVVIETVTAVTSEATAKAFVKKAREIYLNMRFPSVNYNAWRKVGGYGNDLLTWTNPDDVVFLIRSDIINEIDVDVLASAFNMSKIELMGRILPVDNFDIYEGTTKIYDGSAIIGFMGDKSWFRIKEQEMTMDEFYNPNNRTWQIYLNDVRMYAYSLFANGVVFATEMPTVTATKIEFVDDTAISLKVGDKVVREVVLTPYNSTSTVTFTSSDSTVASVRKIDDRHVEITGVAEDADTITITATTESTLTDTLSVTVPVTP